MPAIRVTSQGPSLRTGAAGLPVPAADARAWQSRGQVSGTPGTVSVPAPWPEAVPQDRSFTALHKSSDARPSWRPSVYYLTGAQEHAPVSVLSDNQMPVPALSGNGKAAVVMRGPVFLRQNQVGTPVVTPRYPWRS